MGIFNQQAVSPWQHNTTNKAGGKAYTIDPRAELVTILLTSFVQDKFYRSKAAELTRLTELAKTVDPLFAAKAAIFARTEFGMRSISHALAGELAKRVKGADWTDRFFAKVSYRPDDMLEIVQYYLSRYATKQCGKKRRAIPNAMKRGFAHALTKFDHYQLAKYRCEGKEFKLVDLVNLVHPKHTPAIGKLVADELRNRRTSESVNSAAGKAAAEIMEAAESGEISQEEAETQAAQVRSDAWEQLIDSRQIGYMNLLRNLRNILEKAPKVMGKALALLQDEKLIRNSKVFPFQYYTAYEELQKSGNSLVRTVLPALGNACDISLGNIPKLPGKTLIALDKSGSMRSRIKISSQLAAVLYKANESQLIIFDDKASILNANPRESTLSLTQTIVLNCQNMGGTNFSSVFEALREKYDRIILLSDEQSWGGSQSSSHAYRAYCSRMKCRPSLFIIDTDGLGTLQFPEDKVRLMTGFSEKIFEMIAKLEEDPNVLLNTIEAVKF